MVNSRCLVKVYVANDLRVPAPPPLWGVRRPKDLLLLSFSADLQSSYASRGFGGILSFFLMRRLGPSIYSPNRHIHFSENLKNIEIQNLNAKNGPS